MHLPNGDTKKDYQLFKKISWLRPSPHTQEQIQYYLPSSKLCFQKGSRNEGMILAQRKDLFYHQAVSWTNKQKEAHDPSSHGGDQPQIIWEEDWRHDLCAFTVFFGYWLKNK